MSLTFNGGTRILSDVAAAEASHLWPSIEPEQRRDFRYDAFLSYSHRAGGRLAPATQRGLRQLGRPWYRPPDLAVFRDQTSLSATPALWPSIERALSVSRWFVLFASRDAAASPWVNKEIQWWLGHAPSRRLLLVLTEGEICWDAAAGDFDPEASTAVPASLFGVFDEEPKWVDLRWADGPERVTLRHPVFRECVASLAAPIRGVSKEVLVDEDVRQQRRRIRWRNAAIGGLAVLTVMACLLALVAVAQRNTARRERDVAISRQLAATAESLQSTQPDLALLLAVEAVRQRPTQEAWNAVQAALSQPMHASWRLNGPTGAINAVATTKDGRIAAAATTDGDLFVWRVADGRQLVGPIRTGDSTVYSIDISPDGTLIATGGSKGYARLWRTADGSPAGAPLLVDRPIYAVAFSPDGSELATGDWDGAVRLWDTATGEALGSVVADDNGVSDIAYLPSGDGLLTAGLSGDVRRWDPVTLKSIGPAIPAGINTTLSVTPDGKLVATIASDGRVRLWDLPSGRRHEPDRIGPPDVQATAFSPDGRTLATSTGKVAQLWDVATGQEAAPPFAGSTDYLYALAFSGNGRRLITGGGDKHPRIWDIATSQPIGRTLQVADEVFDVALTPDGRFFAAGSSGYAALYRSGDGKRSFGPLSMAAGATTTALSPDGSVLAVGDRLGKIRLWRPPMQSPLGAAMNSGAAPIYDMAFSPDARVLAAAGFDSKVWLWDIPSGRPLHPLREPGGDPSKTGDISSIAFDPGGHTIAGATLEGPVYLWDLESGKVIETVDEGDKASTAIAFSPDGRELAQGTNTGIVRIIDVATRRVTCDLHAHDRWVEAVAFSPDGKLLATGAQDSSVRLWDTSTCRSAAAPLLGFRDDVMDVAFSSDGRQLVMASLDGTVRMALTPSGWLAAACDAARRNLTRAEWSRYRPGPYRKTCDRWP